VCKEDSTSSCTSSMSAEVTLDVFLVRFRVYVWSTCSMKAMQYMAPIESCKIHFNCESLWNKTF
jgi:hypothetical protein